MSVFAAMQLNGGMPPQLSLPSFGDAALGWLLGLAVFVGPIAFSIVSWQRKQHRWYAFFSQWHTLAFWMLLLGTSVAAIGMFGLMGVIPAWQTAWSAWYLAVFQQNTNTDLTTLVWNQAAQQQYAFALQITAALIFLGGATLIFLAVQRLARALVQSHVGPDDWLTAVGPDSGTSTMPTSRALTHPFSTQQ